jgi:LPXTG-motif cell wall-anchored protein
MKRIVTALLAFSILLCLSLIAHAHDAPQERDDCSINVTVRYNSENVDGGTLTAIKVGYVDQDDGNYFFSQAFTGLKLEDIASPGAAAVQEEFYTNNKDNYSFYTQTRTVTNGKATFSGLSTGLYLIVQEQLANGFSRMNAFLVAVPYLENGEYQYHVTAMIKSELDRELEPTEPSPTEPEDPKLPQTGQLNWPIPIMAAAGLAFFVFGWILCFRKKKEF